MRTDRVESRAPVALRVARCVVVVLGLSILIALLIAPRLGIHAFWNVLIPIAPALLVVAPRLWRNMCPLATAALLPRHLGCSRRRKMSAVWQGRLNMLGVLLLFAMVPLRHVVLDTSGPATALVLLALSAGAVCMGVVFDWKTGWCSGACPVHVVEELYGDRPVACFANRYCTKLFVGAFPGFIWAWFHVPDFAPGTGWPQLVPCYGLLLLGGLASLMFFMTAWEIVSVRRRPALMRVFAAAAVSCYYWFRLPALVGFGVFPGDGMLIDLSGVLPPEIAWLPGSAATAFFVWWLVLRAPTSDRPQRRRRSIRSSSSRNVAA